MNAGVVYCLCADWCTTCREYAAVFADAAREFSHHRFVWIDIEDDADAMGDVDIETFPTLLIAEHDRVRFLGPVLPGREQVGRLLNALRESSARGGAQADALLARLNALERAAVAPPR